jgi:hypothetical protein
MNLCSVCARVVCTDCVKLPVGAKPYLEHQEVCFICPRCHRDRERDTLKKQKANKASDAQVTMPYTVSCRPLLSLAQPSDT